MSEKRQTVIFFMRHGQTDRTYSPDPATDDLRVLSKKGKEQFRKVGEYLAQFSPVKVYTSPRHRTVESAEIIAHQISSVPSVEKRDELSEIYSNEAYQGLAKRIPGLFTALISAHAGEQIVCVSHQDTIQGGLDAYDLPEAEKDFPCQVAEGYRLVFADSVLVECQKIRPANEV